MTKIIYNLTTKFMKESAFKTIDINHTDKSQKESTQTITSTTKPKSAKWKSPKSKAMKRTKLIAKTIRDSVCAITAFTSSNLLLLLLLLLNSDNTILWALNLMLIVMDHSINIICLYFQHKHSMLFYNKCCSKFHGCIYRLFYMKIKKRVAAQTQSVAPNTSKDLDVTTKTTTSSNTSTSTPDESSSSFV